MLLKTLVDNVLEDALPILPENFVKDILDKADKTPEKSRAGTYKNHVHVSSLAYNFCPRQYAIAIKEKLSLYESHTGGHKVTWRLGRAAEEHVREGFISNYGKKNIYAKWICSSCEEKYREGFFKNVSCDCGGVLDKFAEPDIQDDENGVKGHPDLVFNYKKTLFIMEIKSMNARDWEALEEPLHAHILQAGMYPKLLALKRQGISPVVTFIYVTKDFKWGSPYKEFHVDMSEQKYVDLHENMLKEAKEVKDFVEKGISPQRICPSMSSNLAKKCPVAFRCFHTYEDKIE